MPSSKNYVRDYKKEYKKYHSKKKQKLQRARNNAANRDAKASGKIKKGDGKDVAHSRAGAKGKTFVQSASKNRSFARDKKARRK